MDFMNRGQHCLDEQAVSVILWPDVHVTEGGNSLTGFQAVMAGITCRGTTNIWPSQHLCLRKFAMRDSRLYTISRFSPISEVTQHTQHGLFAAHGWVTVMVNSSNCYSWPCYICVYAVIWIKRV